MSRLIEAVGFLREWGRDLYVRACSLLERPGARASPHSGRRILIVDDMLPDPAFGAGYPRAADIVRALAAAGWKISVYPMYAERDHYRSAQSQVGPEIELLPSSGRRGLSRLLRTKAHEFNVILISRPVPMKAYAETLERFPAVGESAPCIYDAEALIARREALRRETFGEPMSFEEEERLIADEVQLASGARAILAVTAVEAGQFAERLGIPAHVVGHGIPSRADAPPVSGRRDFLFVGRSMGDRAFSPNVDSLFWFATEVMPELDRIIGVNYRLLIIGLADDATRRQLESERVIFKGLVRDTAPFYDACRVFVAPTRFSAGLPFKVCEALGMGLPCVATDQLIEQMGLSVGREVEGASSRDPRAFAEACARLYTDDDLWHEVQLAGLAKISADFSTEAFRGSVRAALEPFSAS